MRFSTLTLPAVIGICALAAGCSGQSSGPTASPSAAWDGPVQGMRVTFSNTSTQGMGLSAYALGQGTPNSTPLAVGATAAVESPGCTGTCTTGVNGSYTLQSSTAPVSVELRNQGGATPYVVWCYKSACTNQTTFSPGDTRSFPVQEPVKGTQIATLTIRRANDIGGVLIWSVSLGS
ncbi:MAG: hypothetical protein WCP28_09460 [Actinomycetes bacterium]